MQLWSKTVKSGSNLICRIYCRFKLLTSYWEPDTGTTIGLKLSTKCFSKIIHSQVLFFGPDKKGRLLLRNKASGSNEQKGGSGSEVRSIKISIAGQKLFYFGSSSSTVLPPKKWEICWFNKIKTTSNVFFFIGAGTGPGQKNTRSWNRSKMDQLRKTGIYSSWHPPN